MQANSEDAVKEHCHANRDGDCGWSGIVCPQIQDGEPAQSGRSCPLPDWPEEGDEDDKGTVLVAPLPKLSLDASKGGRGR